MIADKSDDISHSVSDEDDDASVARSLSPLRRRLIFSTMYLGAFVAVIAQSMVITALPAIMYQFDVDAALGQLLTTSYIFVLGLVSATTAFLINRFNSKTLFLVSMGILFVGCLGSIFAPSYEVLLASRLLQSAGAGISLPLIQVVALLIFPKQRYGFAMGLVGLIIGFGPALGPALSGVIVDVWCWQAIFVFLAIASACVLVMGVFVQKNVTKQHAVHLDVISMVLFYVGCSLVLFVSSCMESDSPIGVQLFVCLGIALVLMIVFVRRQLRIEEPFLKLSCFKTRTFAVSAVLVVIGQVAMMSASIMVPLYVQDVQGLSATVSGLAITPGALLLGVFNPVTGRLLDLYGPRKVALSGFVILIVGTAAFLPCDGQTPAWVITVLYGFRIIGVACVMMPLTGFACAELSQHDLPQATAIITAFRQIGSAFIVSLLITIMAHVADNPIGVDDWGFDVSFMVQILVLAAGLLLSFAFLPKRTGRVRRER